MEIRFVLPSEAAQLARNVVSSFPSKTPDALLRNMESELYQPDEGRYLGCFDDDGTLVGSILMMDFTLNVRGVMMPMGAAAYVSTNFLRKKEHTAMTMLRVLMGKMGYGYCNENILYQPRPSMIRSFGDKSGLSFAGPDDKEDILRFYRAYAERTNGATVHHFMDPHRIFDMPYVVICRRDGRITGYLTFEFVDVDHYTDMYHDLMVREMIYEDAETLKQFMTFFASQVDQIERVRILSPDEYLHVMFKNPDTGENRAHDGCIHEIGRKTMGYMVRIFDIRQYFSVQTHCEVPVSRPFTLALQVRDTFLEHNNGTFLLEVTGGTVTLTETGTPDVTLSTQIADLSSLVMGAIPLREFLAYDRMTLSDPSYAEDIQRAIGWSVKPKNLTYF